MTETKTAILEATASDLRRFLEPHWVVRNSLNGTPDLTPPSCGACGHSSLLLTMILHEAGYHAAFQTGSPLSGDFGFRSTNGWRGHAWVRCGGFIVDITADQFGGPKVRVTNRRDTRYRAGEDVATVEAGLTHKREAEAMLAAWQAHKTAEMLVRGA